VSGGLDILVNNAGVMLLGPAVDADADASEWWRMLDINVNALLYCAQTPVPSLDAARELAGAHLDHTLELVERLDVRLAAHVERDCR